MSVQAVTWALDRRLKGSEDASRMAKRLVLFALANHASGAHGEDHYTAVSIAILAQEAQVSRSTVKRALTSLSEEGLISIVQTTSKGTKAQGSNFYVLHLGAKRAASPRFNTEPPPSPVVNHPPGSAVNRAELGPVQSEPGSTMRVSGEASTHQPHLSNTEDLSTEVITKTDEEKLDLEGEFESFWSLSWRRGPKAAARRAYLALRRGKSSPPPAELHHSAKVQRLAYEGTDPKWRCHVATWLNQRRWEDEETQEEDENLIDLEEQLKATGWTPE